MKVSLNWLNELVELPQDPAILSELLTKAGVEVEGIETRGVSIANVVVAQILESNRHPNADRLSVCRVDDGSGHPRQIVCGAKNYKPGDKVPLALPGAVMPGNFKIKVGKLRGVESEGMMCSAKELGLPEGVDGLLILPESSVTGTPVSALFPSDTILDLEVTPNRPDLLSHVGMAREIATLVKKPLRLPEGIIKAGATGVQPVPSESIALEAPEACPFYTARRIRGVKVGPSPAWLSGKLEAAGVRSINNIVDVTNYVMMELGQPLHAFDQASLNGGIRVRNAAEGEKFLALDGKTYNLGPRHLVIADRQRALGIAGVMGGEETGVTESTTEVLLESAWFTPGSIRRTSRELGLSSDASYRYERGIDPQGVLRASERATQLILEVAGGVAEAAPEAAGTPPGGPHQVAFRLERCRAVLGANVSVEQVEQILTGFGLEKLENGGGWLAPSFRQDLTREIDLIEEVARVIGIEAVPARGKSGFFHNSPADKRHDQAMSVRRLLAGQGFHETRSLTLISENALRTFPPIPFDMLAPGTVTLDKLEERILRVRNPLNEEQVVLRPSLIPGLLEALARNVCNGVRDLHLFEVGRVFLGERPVGREELFEEGDHENLIEEEVREERTYLALLLSGAVYPASWRDAKPRLADFFDLKGVLSRFNLGELSFAPVSHPALALAVEIQSEGIAIGVAGQIPPVRARELGALAPVLVAELDIELFDVTQTRMRFKELPKFPAITRDVAMLAPLAVSNARVEAVLRSANEPLLVDLELFDVFTDLTGEKIPADKKSMAFGLTYRSGERTLTAEEVTAVHNRLKEKLRAELAVTLRE